MSQTATTSRHTLPRQRSTITFYYLTDSKQAAKKSAIDDTVFKTSVDDRLSITHRTWRREIAETDVGAHNSLPFLRAGGINVRSMFLTKTMGSAIESGFDH